MHTRLFARITSTASAFTARTGRVAICAVLLAAGWPHAAPAFDFNDVSNRARQLAAATYQKPDINLPRELQSLTYDQYRDIRYRPERYYWRADKLPFELAFFHQGSYFKDPVRINEISPRGVRRIAFDPANFNYGANKIDQEKMRGLDFAGFRVHYAVNTPHYKDEVLVFLGASYFRALGKGQRFGISARGLAVDTGLPSGEEFPRFVEFWIERPSLIARELVIYGLLDSVRVAGAYRFVLRPGTETIVDVKMRLYLRDKIERLGLAPLTTMFFSGENERSTADDYRPEVHDSDGLSIHAGNGEWIWRPLLNPKRLLITSFTMSNPHGFGLMQRDRSFASYEDLEARYDERPSAWVEPRGKWGSGIVQLVQIPTPDETNDNIVAFWTPDASPRPQQPYDLEYRLLWQKDTETHPPLAWVMQTRRGRGFMRKPDNTIGYVVDFVGGAFRKLPRDAKVESMVTLDANAELIENHTYANEVTGGWRMILRMRRLDDKKPVEMRAFLRNGNEIISETWSYILPPG
jgi:periplasmic glucans biosynthesis protein